MSGTSQLAPTTASMQTGPDMNSVQPKTIWMFRMLCEKHYGSRLAYLSGFLFRDQIIKGVQHVGLSAKLDYHHYFKRGFTMVPVDITVTTTAADLFGIIVRSIEKLQAQDLVVTVPLVFQKEVATAIFTRENLRRWGKSLRFKFVESTRKHEKGTEYFENRSKLDKEGTSCEEQIVVIRYNTHSMGYYGYIREIVMKGTEYMLTLSYKFPNQYPFWKLEKDEKTTARFPYYYTRTKAEMPWTARQIAMYNGTYKEAEGTKTNKPETKEFYYEEPDMDSRFYC